MTAETHTFEVGDQVCIVGSYRPVANAGAGTVTELFPGETYDVWARFGQHDYPFRSAELAAIEGARASDIATFAAPFTALRFRAEPSGPVTFFRGARLGALVGMVLLLGFFTGFLAAPVQTVEIRTTITNATPPVCLHAGTAGRTKDVLAETAAAHHDAVLQHTIDAFEAQVYGNTDAMLAAQKAANDEKLLRDEALRGEDNARVSFENHTAACETWKVAQRTTERIAR